ncbi:Methyltransferase domain-containing protein [Halobacillus alkaliphilus]|uniref:Methyltransferase domain-containing protein n=1 Tax=Halobacillus alkaliphilus TaxID=396056 RepID=A0A1I2RMB5_9BACI|nr:class I SAM-dependent methyltransferase [Halobacillus alkaliphilus]SFG40619.1 Methyltransferase domain-containing protein [Halobacillus alkaliphilus]
MDQTFNWHQEAAKQWDERAEFWNERSQTMWEEGSRKTIIPFLKNYLPTGKAVADLGCGDGYGSYKLYEEGYQVTGVDLSKDMIERAVKRLQTEGLDFTQGDLTKLPFATESFDGIMAINSLEWIEVPHQGLEEMKRILRPGGKLCIGILGPTAMPRINSYPRVYGEKVICNTMMPWELAKLAEETGWKYAGGQGVYKRGVDENQVAHLDEDLKQALTFMWIFIFEKKN